MTTKPASYSLAIVADWLPTFGGAEHVLYEWCTMWPSAPIFTTVVRKNAIGPLQEYYHNIHPTYLQKIYRIFGNHQVLLPLMPRAIESINLTGFDVILSSSHAVAKGCIPPSNAVHVCYCHTPMRYAWEMEEQYLEDFKVPRMLRPFIKHQLQQLREWDLTTAKRTDYFIANSTETQSRIARVYGRESVVLTPPASDHFFDRQIIPFAERTGSYLALGRLVPYKRFDLLIEAANAYGFTLTIAGTGQDEARLRAMAGPTVQFIGYVPDADLPALFANSTALLWPQFEDAGVTPIEAQACGTPIVAYGKGGALDTILDGVTGVFFTEQTKESLHSAIQKLQTLSLSPEVIRTHARKFSATAYRQALEEHIHIAYETYHGNVAL
jgi:glycosyltransferase involved in cell wall biosynthesis